MMSEAELAEVLERIAQALEQLVRVMTGVVVELEVIANGQERRR